MPYISVIVPIYNAELTLQKCVDSLLSQTISDFEILLIDDGSTDHSGTICNMYAKQDARITAVYQSNSGVSVARNTGLQLASGQLIAFVDSDDYVEHDYLSTLSAHVSDLTISGFIAQDQFNNTVYQISLPRKSYYNRSDIEYAELYQQCALYSPYSKLFSRRIIAEHSIRFPQNVNWGEDGMFVSEYLKYASHIEVLDYCGYHYLVSSQNSSLATKVRLDIIDDIVLAREYCINQMRITSPGCYDAVKKVCEADIRGNCIYFIRSLLSSNAHSRKQKQEIFEYFLTNPYIQDLVQKADVYFPGNPVMQKSLSHRSVRNIIISYTYLSKKQSIAHMLRKKISRFIPNKVKCFLRRR